MFIAHQFNENPKRLCRLPCGKAQPFRPLILREFARLSLAKMWVELSVRQSLTARIAAKPLWIALAGSAFTAVALHGYTVLTSLNALAHPVNLFVY